MKEFVECIEVSLYYRVSIIEYRCKFDRCCETMDLVDMFSFPSIVRR